MTHEDNWYTVTHNGVTTQLVWTGPGIYMMWTRGDRYRLWQEQPPYMAGSTTRYFTQREWDAREEIPLHV